MSLTRQGCTKSTNMFLYIETLRLAIEERSNGIAFVLQGRTSMQLWE